jgi:hypothetical protein
MTVLTIPFAAERSPAPAEPCRSSVADPLVSFDASQATKAIA